MPQRRHPQGAKTLRATLVECAHGASQTRGCQFEAHYGALAAHEMLRIIYVVLKTATPYYDRAADYEALMVKRNAPRWIRMLRRYGYVTPMVAEPSPA